MIHWITNGLFTSIQMEKPRTIIKKYTIPILFNFQDSKLWIITGCGKVRKITIPKN